jgi:hypothetical protein
LKSYIDYFEMTKDSFRFLKNFASKSSKGQLSSNNTESDTEPLSAIKDRLQDTQDQMVDNPEEIDLVDDESPPALPPSSCPASPTAPPRAPFDLNFHSDYIQTYNFNSTKISSSQLQSLKQLLSHLEHIVVSDTLLTDDYIEQKLLRQFSNLFPLVCGSTGIRLLRDLVCSPLLSTPMAILVGKLAYLKTHRTFREPCDDYSRFPDDTIKNTHLLPDRLTNLNRHQKIWYTSEHYNPEHIRRKLYDNILLKQAATIASSPPVTESKYNTHQSPTPRTNQGNPLKRSRSSYEPSTPSSQSLDSSTPSSVNKPVPITQPTVPAPPTTAISTIIPSETSSFSNSSYYRTNDTGEYSPINQSLNSMRATRIPDHTSQCPPDYVPVTIDGITTYHSKKHLAKMQQAYLQSVGTYTPH